MRVLICGGRDFHDFAGMKHALDTLSATWPPDVTVIEGGAKGADALAAQWAREKGYPVEEYPADWDTHRLAAGPIRNRRMLEEGKPDLVLAFPGGAGTANMLRIAREAGVATLEITV